MGVLDSLRVIGAMARVTLPSVLDIVRARLDRDSVDDRARWFGQRVVQLLDIDLRVTGGEAIDHARAYIYMANHQSHLDIPVLYASLPSPTIRMLGKAELFKIPVWGAALRAAEFIEVDRGNRDRARASIDRAAELVRQGVSIYLAPEGTRSVDGRIGVLKKGGFHLALGTGAPIVPVAIDGTLDILPRGTTSMRTGCEVAVTIGEPIDVTGRELGSLIAEVAGFFKSHVEG